MTPEAKRALCEQLPQPFPEEAIGRTNGRQTGKGYSTTGIKAQFIINRLNEALADGGHVSTSEAEAGKVAQRLLAAPRPLVRGSSGCAARPC